MDSTAAKKELCERIWLNYFNKVLLERKVIDETKWRRMDQKYKTARVTT